VLERPVVAEDDVQDGLGLVLREARDVLDEAADPVVAQGDVALEATRVGDLDAQRVARVLLELADVVQQRARDRDVAVDPSERLRDRRYPLGDGERMLEQPVDVGLVVVLRGGGRPERTPGVGVRS